MSRHAHEVEKFCLFFDTAEQDQVPLALARFHAVEGIEVVQGSPDNLEVTCQPVWTRARLCWRWPTGWACPAESTLAVGDSENDRAMLEKAGAGRRDGQRHGAHQGSGRPMSVTADCDHDGVAEIFRKPWCL